MIYFAVLGASYGVRAMQLEASLTRAQLTALELQLQPHFLFNTLHTVAGLVRENRRDEAVAMIANLSELLRYSLDHAGSDLTTLRDEIAVVRRYLDIQRMRFSDRLGVQFDIAEATDNARVPTLLLQPLVENAIRHGAERVATDVEISLKTRREDNTLVIELENTAMGSVHRDGIGFTNTKARLVQLYGSNHRFEFRVDAGRAVTTLRMPWQ
jgi:LytS/YehU family sensor histidine kinase